MGISQSFVRPISVLLAVVAATAVFIGSLGLASGVTELGTGSDRTLTVRARGSVGAEQMVVRVAGAELATFTVGTEWRDYRVETPSSSGAPDVEVAFVNDAANPADHNLWVDSVSYGGHVYEAEAETTLGTGVWANGGRCRPGYHRHELLACNGHLGFGDLPGVDAVAEPGPAGDFTEIVFSAAGSTGNEMVEIRVGGSPVATFRVEGGSDLHLSPNFGDYRYRHRGVAAVSDVAVAFVNDRYAPGFDNNVAIDSITVGGTTYDADTWELHLATARNDALCRRSWDSSGIIACNGRLQPKPLVGGSELPAAAGPIAAEPEPTVLAATVPPGPEPAVPTEAAPEETVPVETVPVGTVPAEAVPEQTVPVETVPVETVPAETTEVPASTTRSTVAPTPPPTTSPTTARPTSTTRPAPPAGGNGATDQFYVVGTDIIGPDGDVFYPIGANVAIKFTPYGYVFEGNNGGVNDHLDDVEAWNWNTIRATLICNNTSGVPSFNELVDGIHPTIERFTAAGIVVILECHDLTGTDPRLGSAEDLAIRRFWDRMALRYQDNPYVWFNIYNEPYASDDTANWTRLHEFYVDRIRSAGAENIVVADIPVWGQGIHLLADQSFADGLNNRCNTVFGWHAYGAIDNTGASLAEHERRIQQVQAKGMALLIGEYGVATPANWGNAGPWMWNISGFDALSALGPQYGIGLLWWHATGDEAYYSLYALKNDRSGFWTAGNAGNLTPYGQKFWDVSQRVDHSRGSFNGDLAASGCPSASR